MTYDEIADEYYTPRRVTSRNFDTATRTAIASMTWSHKDQSYIECGAGRGRTREYLNLDALGCHIDSSSRMLSIVDRENSHGRICADCTNLPIRSASTALVTAWLFDAFNLLEFYCEARRILVGGGEFIGSLPSALWGNTLREHLRMPHEDTTFDRVDGAAVSVPSHLSTNDEIESLLRRAGFSTWEILSGHIETSDTPISPHIEIVADRLKVPVPELPIVTLVNAVAS